ncbi:MAG TPA: DUF3413 domain-containing protein, partial [Coxiellaceae bacterium]|nr:DUF3413 domain-containing protein [Coxiellaceae bacterium]
MLKKIAVKISPQQKKLARWASWFFLANVLLWILIATNYLSLLPKFDSIVALSWRARISAIVFLVSSLIGYFSLIAYSAWIVVACLSAYASRRWVFLLSISLAFLLSLLLIIDSLIYHLFHFHLWGVVWPIIAAGVAPDVLVLSSHEWLLLSALTLVLLALEIFLAWLAWIFVERHTRIKEAKYIALIIGVAFFLSYALLVKSYAAVQTKAQVVVSTQLINLEAQLIPFYNAVMGALLPEKEGALKLQTRGGGAFLQLQQVSKNLAYPLHPLECHAKTKSYNILLIVVDALRFETLNAKVMPS